MPRPTNAASADAIKQYLDARYWRKDAPRTHHVWGRLNYGPDFVDEPRTLPRQVLVHTTLTAPRV